MDEDQKYWQRIQSFVKERFGMKGDVYDIIYLVGVQELGYGFQQLDQAAKTKVINFASMYLMKFMDHDQRREIRSQYDDDEELEEQFYRKAIIRYFQSRKIFES